jgi:hypothetical protein
MRRLLLLILGFVATWLGATLPAVAAAELPARPELVHAYIYDTVGAAAQSPDTNKRGPPAGDNTARYDTYRYDQFIKLAQVAHDPGTVEGSNGHAQGASVVVDRGPVAANSGSRIALNQAAGNAARDAISAAHPGSLIEQSFTTTAGVRRLDVLTRGLVGIESKVGRTSLTGATRSQIAKDSLLLQNGDVNGIQWVFSRSGVTGQIGPTGPLADALSKAGIPWSLAP